MSDYRIRRAAVLGAGTMGSRIAAHLANAGIPSFLLDITPAELKPEEARAGMTIDSPPVKNRIVTAGWRAALTGKPAALFSPELASMVTTGNFADDLKRVAEADWIIEAVTENLGIKRSLFEQVQRYRKPGTIISSNTSGIPLHGIAEGFPEEFQTHFLGTHFFNPPRYLALLELIPVPATDPGLVRFMTRFGEATLGKGVVACKDTPGFIANRIGTQNLCLLLRAMADEGLTVQQVDALTGPVLGRPKSATFRTLDIVGLDVFAHVARNFHSALPQGERDEFVLPPLYESMLSKGLLGEKSGQGFYKRLKSGEIQHLDYSTFEYQPLEKSGFPLLEKISKESLPRRLSALASDESPAGKFVWEIVSSTMRYAAAKVPEISDDVVSIDNAMKWGFGHEIGPFETWDALGVKASAERMAKEGKLVPPLVEKLLSSGNSSFYQKKAGKTFFFTPAGPAYDEVPENPEVIVLRSLKEREKTVLENRGASLIDLGDGVACLEFHTKMNTLDADILNMANQSLERVVKDFEGLVIGNQGENFSAGANIMMMLGAAKEGRWEVVDKAVRSFQALTTRLRYCEKPVVVAPHNLTLGGGCEVAIHGALVHASAELYMGFAETGVGLIPAAGGCKEMALRASEAAGSGTVAELEPKVREIFQLIGMAKISTSAFEARQFGLLREKDHITMSSDRRIKAAKDDVLSLVREGYRPPVPPEIIVLGRPGLATLKLGLHMMHRAGYISEYDKEVGTRLAEVLTGGCHLGIHKVSEQYLLELEREAFLSLCGQAKTQERMEYMLRNGKPLRN